MKDPHIGIQIVHSSKAHDRNLGKAYNEKYPEYDLFTCLTNRVGCDYQLADVDRDNHDIRYHREMAKRIEVLNKNNEVTDITNNLPYLSGMMMMFRFLGVDNDFHKRVKNRRLKVGLINTLYIYHWYIAEQ